MNKNPPRSEENHKPAGLEARRAALDILMLTRSGSTLDEALEACRSFDDLDGPDRGFARAIATTVLRRRGTIDHAIGVYVDRPLPKKSVKATDIMRLAAAQSLLMGVPAHAVVSIAVSLTKEFQETAGYAGLVNAVTRKIAVAGESLIKDIPKRIDTPGWMWRSWERSYGLKTAREIAEAHQREAALDLTAKNPSERAALADQLSGELLATGSIRIKAGGGVSKLAGFDEGQWWVQDTAASLPVQLLGDVNGKRVFDLCAAPGGKTMQLAAAGARVVAVDQVGMRLKTIQENLDRVKLRAETVRDDILEWRPSEKADAVLLDAPCSATGTIRRHPDILWSKTEDDVKALAALQSKMIDKAVSMLKPGGVLVYCTCSMQPEEGETQIEDALARHSDLKRVPIEPAEIGGLEAAINRQGDMRTLPTMLGGIDGFFAARLRLNESSN